MRKSGSMPLVIKEMYKSRNTHERMHCTDWKLETLGRIHHVIHDKYARDSRCTNDCFYIIRTLWNANCLMQMKLSGLMQP